MIFKRLYLLILLCGSLISVMANPLPARNLVIPKSSITSKTIILLWDKPSAYKDVAAYQIFKDGKLSGTSVNTNFTVSSLLPGKMYTFYIKAQDKDGNVSEGSSKLKAATKLTGKVFNVLDFRAVGDGVTKNTKAIQRAIDACTKGGTVYIPAGKFVSGALHLKSNMTLYIAKGGILKGSTDTADYLPIILNRFEGWEMETYASLLNAGKLDRSGKYNVVNLSIQGKGTISGGGYKLRDAMIAKRGKRGRGRLICIMNGQI